MTTTLWVLLGLLSLPACYLFARYTSPAPVSNDCYCLTSGSERFLLILGFITSVLLVFLELGLHLTMLHTNTGVEQVLYHDIWNELGPKVMSAQIDVDPYNRNPGEMWNVSVWPPISGVDHLYQKYKRYSENILALGKKIETLNADPEFMPLKQYILKHFWLRYLFFHLLWLQPLGCYLIRIACSTGVSVYCAVFGLIFCWVMGSMVLAQATALSDYCTKPDSILTSLPMDEQIKYLNHYCMVLNEELEVLVSKYIRYFANSMEQSVRDVGDSAMQSYQQHYEQVEYLQEYCWVEVKMLYSKAWTQWHVLQLMAILFIAFLCIAMLIMIVTRMTANEAVEYNLKIKMAKKLRKLKEERLKKAKKTAKLDTSKSTFSILSCLSRKKKKRMGTANEAVEYNLKIKMAKKLRKLKEERLKKAKKTAKLDTSKSTFSILSCLSRKKKKRMGRPPRSRLIQLPDDVGHLTSAMLLDVDKETKVLIPLKPVQPKKCSTAKCCLKKE